MSGTECQAAGEGLCHSPYLTALLEYGGQYALIVDLDRRLMACNLAFARVLGKATVAEAVGCQPTRMLVEAGWQLLGPSGDNLDRPGREIFAEMSAWEEEVVSPAGERRWSMVRRFPIRDEAGRLLAGAVVITDITDIKHGEAAQRDAAAYHAVLARVRGVSAEGGERELWEAQLAGLVAEYGFLMAWCGEYRDGQVRPMYHAGQADKYLAGLVLDIRQPDSPDANCAMSQAILNEQPFGYADLARDEGFRRWRDYALELGYASNLALPARIGGQVSHGVMVYGSRPGEFTATRVKHLAMLVDDLGRIIESRREHRRLQERLSQAEKLQAVGQLAGGIAHDFNNQLVCIKGYANLLQEELPQGVWRKYASVIDRSADRAAGLTGRLLAFARKGPAADAVVDLRRLTDDTLALLERTIDRRIRVERHYAADRTLIRGDASQLQNALLNLCLNARDAMPRGGQLRLELKLVELTVAELAGRPELAAGTYADVEVSDTGSGMDPQTLERIFDPFFTTKEKGTGLGLTSVLEAVRNHGGLLAVRSEPGRGTVFSLRLPLAGAAAATPVGAVADLAIPAGRWVMIVDDDDTVRDYVGEILTRAGLKVELCSNGLEALEKYTAEAGRFDLILLNLIMPGLGGREVFAGLRQINAAARVIFISGFGPDGENRRLLTDRQIAFLQKPFSREELLAAVARQLAVRSA